MKAIITEILKIENRAWEKAEYPRLVSEEFECEGKVYVLEISFHHGMRLWTVDAQYYIINKLNNKRMVEVISYPLWYKGDMDTANSLEGCFKIVEEKYKRKPERIN